MIHGIDQAGRRVHAVERDPGAGQVEVVGGAQKYPRRIGQAGRRPRQAGARGPEPDQLPVVERMPGFLGAGQVAHHQDQVEALQARWLLGQALQFVGWQPQAVHAGVYVQGGGELPGLRMAQAAPSLDLGQAVQHRDEVVTQVVPFRAQGEVLRATTWWPPASRLGGAKN